MVDETPLSVRHPDGPPVGGVVVVQEVFGVTPHIEAVCQRLADVGWLAVAPHLFHRTGDPVLSHNDIAEGRRHAQSLTVESILADVGAALAYVEGAGFPRDTAGIVGFCMGGTVALAVAAGIPGATGPPPSWWVPAPGDGPTLPRRARAVIRPLATSTASRHGIQTRDSSNRRGSRARQAAVVAGLIDRVRDIRRFGDSEQAEGRRQLGHRREGAATEVHDEELRLQRRRRQGHRRDERPQEGALAAARPADDDSVAGRAGEVDGQGVAALLGLMMTGMPLGIVTLTVSIGTALLYFGPRGLFLVASNVYGLLENYPLVAVPLFVFMASILERAGVAEDLFNAMSIVAGDLRGGVAVQTTLVAVVMAAMTGIIGGLLQMGMGLLVDRYGARRLLGSGVVLLGLGVWLLTVSTTVWQFGLAYGIF